MKPADLLADLESGDRTKEFLEAKEKSDLQQMMEQTVALLGGHYNYATDPRVHQMQQALNNQNSFGNQQNALWQNINGLGQAQAGTAQTQISGGGLWNRLTSR